MSEPTYANHPEFVPEWDIYRDPDGNPVTIDFDCQYMSAETLPRPLTPRELAAVRRAVEVHKLVCAAENDGQHDGACVDGKFSWLTANAHKSRLLGRMIHDGKPPTRTKPPVQWAEPRWDLMPGGDPFGALVERSTPPENEEAQP